MFFRDNYPNVRIGHADPCGAALHRYYQQGELKAVGDSITEGIGQGRVTAILEGFIPDYSFEIDVTAAMKACFEFASMRRTRPGNEFRYQRCRSRKIGARIGSWKCSGNHCL